MSVDLRFYIEELKVLIGPLTKHWSSSREYTSPEQGNDPDNMTYRLSLFSFIAITQACLLSAFVGMFCFYQECCEMTQRQKLCFIV